jgi:hypothetical protein
MAGNQETMALLEKAFAERNARMVNLAVHPHFAFLRGDPAFENLLVRMNVPANLRHPVTSKSTRGGSASPR